MFLAFPPPKLSLDAPYRAQMRCWQGFGAGEARGSRRVGMKVAGGTKGKESRWTGSPLLSLKGSLFRETCPDKSAKVGLSFPAQTFLHSIITICNYLGQGSANLNMHMNPLGFFWQCDSNSGSLGRGLRFSISNNLSGGDCVAGTWTPVWVERH